MTSLPMMFLPQFEADLLGYIDNLEREAGTEVADRFFVSVREATAFLCEFPNVGMRCELANPQLVGLRAWPVSGFRKWLIFFRRTTAGLECVRLLHGHRDWPGLLSRSDPSD